MVVRVQSKGGLDAGYLGAIGQLQQPNARNWVPEGISTGPALANPKAQGHQAGAEAAPPGGLVHMARTAHAEQAVPATSRRPQPPVELNEQQER